MSTHTLSPPGAAPVGQIAQLSPLQQLAVLCMRGLGRRDDDLRARLAAHFGHDGAIAVMSRCDDLLQFLSRHAHRPLSRHQPDCSCLGADEAAFAHLCALADRGERDELLMFAMLMARADMAPCLVPLAEAFVLTLKRGLATGYRQTPGCPVHSSPTFH